MPHHPSGHFVRSLILFFCSNDNRGMSSPKVLFGFHAVGVRQLTRKTCDELVSIPMKGAVESLNVSVASGVCLYEALRQRG